MSGEHGEGFSVAPGDMRFDIEATTEILASGDVFEGSVDKPLWTAAQAEEQIGIPLAEGVNVLGVIGHPETGNKILILDLIKAPTQDNDTPGEGGLQRAVFEKRGAPRFDDHGNNGKSRFSVPKNNVFALLEYTPKPDGKAADVKPPKPLDDANTEVVARIGRKPDPKVRSSNSYKIEDAGTYMSRHQLTLRIENGYGKPNRWSVTDESTHGATEVFGRGQVQGRPPELEAQASPEKPQPSRKVFKRLGRTARS